MRKIGQDAEVTCEMLFVKGNPEPRASVGTVILQGILVHYRAISVSNIYNKLVCMESDQYEEHTGASYQ